MGHLERLFWQRPLESDRRFYADVIRHNDTAIWVGFSRRLSARSATVRSGSRRARPT